MASRGSSRVLDDRQLVADTEFWRKLHTLIRAKKIMKGNHLRLFFADLVSYTISYIEILRQKGKKRGCRRDLFLKNAKNNSVRLLFSRF